MTRGRLLGWIFVITIIILVVILTTSWPLAVRFAICLALGYFSGDIVIYIEGLARDGI